MAEIKLPKMTLRGCEKSACGSAKSEMAVEPRLVITKHKSLCDSMKLLAKNNVDSPIKVVPVDHTISTTFAYNEGYFSNLLGMEGGA
eukprot:CAMPEP_0168606480 /NCGR_PEP_ID=MMETSP0420-20121227/16592_1 /TAXON_ID=498008 /ORGANISM="Pessonella sp." /LENGTH=86 /DNA_ID=CAMNT_0008646145 /DNA_START=357 /DNA_END=617 /DNA_ORIENTATION=-